jgi:hypothetical protein
VVAGRFGYYSIKGYRYAVVTEVEAEAAYHPASPLLPEIRNRGVLRRYASPYPGNSADPFSRQLLSTIRGPALASSYSLSELSSSYSPIRPPPAPRPTTPFKPALPRATLALDSNVPTLDLPCHLFTVIYFVRLLPHMARMIFLRDIPHRLSSSHNFRARHWKHFGLYHAVTGNLYHSKAKIIINPVRRQ